MSSPNVSAADAKNMSAEDKLNYDKKRVKFFKGTIAICAVYGFFVVALILVMVFNDSAREVLGDRWFPFTVTLIAGMLLVLVFLAIEIFTYKHEIKRVSSAETLMCPDYWNLKETPADNMDLITNGEVKNYMRFKCTPDENVYNTSGWKTGADVTAAYTAKVTAKTATENDKAFIKMQEDLKVTGTDTSKMVQSCTAVYPEMFAYRDRTSDPEKPNTMRCDFLKACGDKFSWVGVCPK